jgi:predicted outer membrane protein
MNKRIALSVTACAVALAAPAHAAAPGVTAQDENYLQTAAAGDSFEIKGGQLALQRSQNPTVQSLARTLIRDHTKSLHEAKRLAKQLGIPKVQNKPTPSQAWELRQLQAKAGADFDRQYTDLEVADHHQDIEETKFEAKKGSAAAVVAGAKKELPMLAKHLKLSREARSSAGG